MEFAFLLPLLVLLVFGIFEFGQSYNRSQGLQAGAREGARYASRGFDSPPDDPILASEVAARTLATIQNDAAGSGFVAGDLAVEVRHYADAASAAVKSGNPLDDDDVVCDGTNVDAVRVDVYVAANEERYTLSIPLLPSFDVFGAESSRFAIFQCLT